MEKALKSDSGGHSFSTSYLRLGNLSLAYTYKSGNFAYVQYEYFSNWVHRLFFRKDRTTAKEVFIKC